MVLGQLVECIGHEVSGDGPAWTLFLEQIGQSHVLEDVECVDISITMAITYGMDNFLADWTR